MFINHVRGAVKAWGAALPGCTAPAFHRAVRGHIPEELGPALLPMFHQIEHLTAEIRRADKQLAAMRGRYPGTGVLRQIVGAGPITSLTFVSHHRGPEPLPEEQGGGAPPRAGAPEPRSR